MLFRVQCMQAIYASLRTHSSVLAYTEEDFMCCWHDKNCLL